jgi:transcription termination factor Rho
MILKLRVLDHRAEERIEVQSGVKFQHIATMFDLTNSRTFVIYTTLIPEVKTYIEEKMDNKLSDSLFAGTVLRQIPEEKLWLALYQEAVKLKILQ